MGSPTELRASQATHSGTRRAFHKHVCCWTNTGSQGPASSQEIQELRDGVPFRNLVVNKRNTISRRLVGRLQCPRHRETLLKPGGRPHTAPPETRRRTGCPSCAGGRGSGKADPGCNGAISTSDWSGRRRPWDSGRAVSALH